ncbi:hypothetical protein [Staphylococcus shinii]|uniref:hypothetical protein n=1 Tax=Staphylococcus shinii TaxID=2912228 RepID=UPI003F55E3E6
METEGDSILEIIGLYTSYENAVSVCEESFENRGFNHEEDCELFENDYKIEEVEAWDNIKLKIKKYEEV